MLAGLLLDGVACRFRKLSPRLKLLVDGGRSNRWRRIKEPEEPPSGECSSGKRAGLLAAMNGT